MLPRSASPKSPASRGVQYHHAAGWYLGASGCPACSWSHRLGMDGVVVPTPACLSMSNRTGGRDGMCLRSSRPGAFVAYIPPLVSEPVWEGYGGCSSMHFAGADARHHRRPPTPRWSVESSVWRGPTANRGAASSYWNRSECTCHSHGPLLDRSGPCPMAWAFIADCLDSIVNNGYPSDRLLSLVVGGIERRRYRCVLRAYVRDHEIHPRGSTTGETTPEGASRVAGSSRGNWCVGWTPCLSRARISPASGRPAGTRRRCGLRVMNTVPSTTKPHGETIAAALTAIRSGSKLAYFRIHVSNPTWVDTSVCGCYRRDVFDRVLASGADSRRRSRQASLIRKGRSIQPLGSRTGYGFEHQAVESRRLHASPARHQYHHYARSTVIPSGARIGRTV